MLYQIQSSSIQNNIQTCQQIKERLNTDFERNSISRQLDKK
jgi:hypothetical protein